MQSIASSIEGHEPTDRKPFAEPIRSARPSRMSRISSTMPIRIMNGVCSRNAQRRLHIDVVTFQQGRGELHRCSLVYFGGNAQISAESRCPFPHVVQAGRVSAFLADIKTLAVIDNLKHQVSGLHSDSHINLRAGRMTNRIVE